MNSSIISVKEKETFVDSLIKKIYPYADENWFITVITSENIPVSLKEYWMENFGECQKTAKEIFG